MSWQGKYNRAMQMIDKLESELNEFNKKYRELQAKHSKAIEMIQELSKTKL